MYKKHFYCNNSNANIVEFKNIHIQKCDVAILNLFNLKK